MNRVYFKNLVGRRFGRWIVIRRYKLNRFGGARWVCRCDCGKQRAISSSSLLRGDSKSCGCLRTKLKIKDLSGQKFGRLTVLKIYKKAAKVFWECECICGNVCAVRSTDLVQGKTQSCGCYGMEVWQRGGNTIHGFSKNDITYNVWKGIKARCYNKNRSHYYRYGGRGIKICKRWKNDFMAFKRDMGERPSKFFSIEREDNNGDYKPSNCRWILTVFQAENRSTTIRVKFGGKVVSLAAACNFLGFPYSAIYRRMMRKGTTFRRVCNSYKKSQNVQVRKNFLDGTVLVKRSGRLPLLIKKGDF